MYVTAERLGHAHGMQVIMATLGARMSLWKRVAWGSTHMAVMQNGQVVIKEQA